MTRNSDEKIKAFVKERDDVLMSGDVDRCIAFHKKHNPARPFPSRDVAEVSMHKARTATRSLPMSYRLASRKWLSERGYTSLDDGELTKDTALDKDAGK
jgi:hypothetical protein